METIKDIFTDFLNPIRLIKISPVDIIEIALIAVLIYSIIKWIKNTRAWTLLKGILVLTIFYVIASLLSFDVILWLFANGIGVSITALVIVFQPELRKALEQLGKKNINIVTPFFGTQEEDKFSEETINGIVKATFEMAKVRTGALIIIERDVHLDEYEATGIQVDARVSSELLINIFEHNTPLHDGAVIIRGNRVAAATCYLPLSDNTNISKELGTRHRAAVGISEVTDSFTIVVSEETGSVSTVSNGDLNRHVSREYLYDRLKELQNKANDENMKKSFWHRDRKNIPAQASEDSR